jgi:triacylglycerol lipase
MPPAIRSQPACRRRVGDSASLISLLCLLLLLMPAAASTQEASQAFPQAEDECVVLVHGLGRGDGSFFLMEEVLQAAGYTVVNLDYPSRKATIQELLGYLDDAVATCGEQTVNFITHSLGGILVRGWLGANHPDRLGRVVMLAPPNQGSEVVDAMSDLPLYRFLTGPVGQQLGTGDDGTPAQLGPARFELGVIAGNRSLNPLFSGMIPGEDDGAVSVENTKIEGMSDHIVLPVTHTFLMNNPLVIAQAAIFLQTGRFDPDLTYRELILRLIAR